MKFKKTGKAVALGLAALSLAAFVGSNIPTQNVVSAYATASEVEFWGTYSSEKILQNKVTIYDDLKQAAVVDVSAIGGEEEATQIIMTSGDKAVKEYDLVLSDLTGENGAKFSKENIKIYHERYIYVGQGAEYYTETGYYPDCLVPFENVKKVGETGFAAKNNQGLYVSFQVPQDQAAGVYTGSFDVVIGGETKQIPITLRVVNGFITEETHVFSSFLNEWYFYRGELDTTEEMYDAYNQKLFDYRLGCNNVTTYHTDVDYYAEKICEYAKNPKCPSYNIRYYTTNYEGSGKVLNGRELNCKISYDVDKLLLYFRKIAYKGLEENVDPFKKAFIYGYDEPDLGLGVQRATVYTKEWAYIVKQCQEMMAEELLADTTVENRELLEQIVESLLDVPHLILSSTFLNNDFDLTVENAVYGPEFQHLESQGARDKYRLGPDNDLWWYGCVEPDYPYPTYHIDDTVLSARLESWMKADYDIQGNLYWATCLYSEPSAGSEAMVYPEDFYSGNAARCLSTNGEGFLFYPGKKYGIYGPVPSLRLEQIRDGLEEYEMIIKMSQIYASIGNGYSEDTIMRYIYDTVYSGTKVSTTSENFEQARAKLLDLFELASSKAQVCVTDVQEVSGGYAFQVYANSGYTPKQAGAEITQKTAVNGGFIYTVNIRLDQGEQLDLSVEVDGKTYSVTMSFGSSATAYDAAYVFENEIIATRNVPVTTELVDATTVNSQAAATEKYIRLHLAEATTSAQDFLLVDDSIIKALDKTVDKFTVRIYNASADTLSGQLLMKYGKNLKTFSKYADIEIKPGMNVFSINNFAGFRWSDIKYIDSVRVMVGEKGDAARDCLYFVDMCVYKK